MGYNLLINEVYWGYNPLTNRNHLLTSWDILVGLDGDLPWVQSVKHHQLNKSKRFSQPFTQVNIPFPWILWVLEPGDLEGHRATYELMWARKKNSYFPWNTGCLIGILRISSPINRPKQPGVLFSLLMTHVFIGGFQNETFRAAVP